MWAGAEAVLFVRGVYVVYLLGILFIFRFSLNHGVYYWSNWLSSLSRTSSRSTWVYALCGLVYWRNRSGVTLWCWRSRVYVARVVCRFKVFSLQGRLCLLPGRVGPRARKPALYFPLGGAWGESMQECLSCLVGKSVAASLAESLVLFSPFLDQLSGR